MIVCIAEKPSVARDIARILGATTSHDGYMEGNGYQVTWTYGHLCTLKEPHDYSPWWKSWNLDTLPMIPDRFGIKLINNEGYEKQFNTIQRLMTAADSIVNCGDAGQEGELIQRWVMQKAGVRCPVHRLWIVMPDKLVADCLYIGSCIAVVDCQVQRDNAIATHRIRPCILRLYCIGSVCGALPCILITDGESLNCIAAMIDCQMKCYDTVAAISILFNNKRLVSTAPIGSPMPIQTITCNNFQYSISTIS